MDYQALGARIKRWGGELGFPGYPHEPGFFRLIERHRQKDVRVSHAPHTYNCTPDRSWIQRSDHNLEIRRGQRRQAPHAATRSVATTEPGGRE